MCGIIGFTGRREAAPILIEGLRRLEYRGYDSAGLVTGTGSSLHVRKKAGRIAELAKAEQASPRPAPLASVIPAGPRTAARPTGTPTRTSTPPAPSPSSTTG